MIVFIEAYTQTR